MNFVKISWQKLYTDCRILSEKIKITSINEIIAISRGGVVMGRLFSDFLDIPMGVIGITSYHGILQGKEPTITQALTRDISGKIILLVDDVSDTGKTFQKAVEYLENIGAKKVYTVSPYIKPHAIFIPDFWQEKFPDWLIFPYEIYEVQKEMEKTMGKEETKKKLLELGAEQWELM